MPVVARFFTIKLRKWFPPNDPLATKVARLLILREDFALEMRGVYEEGIDALDSHSDAWRRLYFLRNLFRTLMEVQSGIQRLLSDKDFKVLLYKQSREVKREFGRLARVIAQAHPIVKEIRNDICGHVKEEAVQEALDEMDMDSFGFWEMGRTLKDSHLKFAGELVANILVRGAAAKDKTMVFAEKMEKVANLVDLLL